jgi:hypothetical protein
MTEASIPETKALWARVAADFYVGSQDGTFLGYVDRLSDGSWRAFDSSSHVIGDFRDHHEAMAAATHPPTETTPHDGSGDGELVR